MCPSQCPICTLHACVQTWTLLVHWSYCLATPCTLKLYTCLGTGLGTCVHFQAVSKLGHSNFYSSAAFVCLERNSLSGYCKVSSRSTAIAFSYSRSSLASQTQKWVWLARLLAKHLSVSLGIPTENSAYHKREAVFSPNPMRIT